MLERWTPGWSNAVFSLEERDGRWHRVRDAMAGQGMDVIVCLPCTNRHDRGQADARYLTQLGENSDEVTVVFPLEGEVAAWHRRPGVWPSSNWLSGVRATGWGVGAGVVVEWLRQQGFAQGRIAIAGLSGGLLARVRCLEGEANWRSVEMIRAAFPAAEVVSATPVLEEVRYQKSEEEIEFLRRGTQVAEAMLDAVAATARPGVAERRVFAEIMRASAAAGGSFPPMVGWVSGPLGDLFHRVEQPTFRSLAAGDAMLLEIEGRWGGYLAQCDQTFSIGPAPQVLRDCFQLAVEAFERIREALRPGATVADLDRAARVTGLGGRAEGRLNMHGRGLGDDGPLVAGAIQPAVLAAEVRERCCYVVKPHIYLDGGAEFCRWGDSVVVRASGAERLGTRRPELVECV